MGKAESGQSVPNEDAEADKIIADAEGAAMEAEGLLAELESRVESGDTSVTRDALEAAEKDRNWLRKLVEGAKARANDLREQGRQSRLAALRQEIDAYSLEAGDDFVNLLANVEGAVKAFADAFKSRNDKLAKWQESARALGVQSMNGRLAPSQKDAGIALVEAPGASVQVDNRVLSMKWSGQILNALLRSMATSHDLVPYYVDDNPGSLSLEQVRALVVNLDHESVAVPEDAVFFRNRGGAVLTTDPAHAFSSDVMKRDGLVQISRAEALNG